MLDEGLEKILRRVQKPGRYTGGEWNAVAKDWDAVQATVALCYPDTYEVGMSSFGMHLLYHTVNSDPRFAAERVFAPWADMAAALREDGRPLYSLDSLRPLRDFDLLCFFLEDELGYADVLETLDLAKLPLLAGERDGSSPLVIGCGPCAANPEPLADFIDLFIVGEPEEAMIELLELVAAARNGAGRRTDKEQGRRGEHLRRASLLPGVYIPSLYRTVARADGTTEAVVAADGTPARIAKRTVERLGPAPTSPVVPFIETTNDRGAIEVQRGCGPGCSRCETGSPCDLVRRRPVAEIAEAVDAMVRRCGYQESLLLSSGAIDLDAAEELAKAIRAKYAVEDLRLKLPPLPVGERSIPIVEALADSRRTSGYPLEPLAATERLRKEAGRPLSEESLFSVLSTAFRRGWHGVRYQFAIGLPTETLEDAEAIVALVAQSQKLGQQLLGRRPRVRVAVSIFIPRPHTVFQRAALEAPERLKAKLDALKRGLKKAGAYATFPEIEPAVVAAVLARGDRRVGRAVRRAWELGYCQGRLADLNISKWLQAFQDCAIDVPFYAHSPRPADEAMPWSHLDLAPPRRAGKKGVSPSTLPAAASH